MLVDFCPANLCWKLEPERCPSPPHLRCMAVDDDSIKKIQHCPVDFNPTIASSAGIAEQARARVFICACALH